MGNSLGWGHESESDSVLGLAEGHISADTQRQIGRQCSRSLDPKGFIFAAEKEIAKACSVGKLNKRGFVKRELGYREINRSCGFGALIFSSSTAIPG